MSFNITKNINKFFPKMGLFLRSFQDAKDKTMPSMNTKWGFSLAGNVEMANGVFEPEETRVVLSLLDEVEFFINVGANIGYYTCHALAKGKRAIAVEPMQRNVYYLLKNIKANGWEKQVEVFPVAVGDIADVLDIWGGGTGASLIKGWANIPAYHVTQVPILTLDRIVDKQIANKKALIVVDIEGAEYPVVQDIENELHKVQHLFIEYHGLATETYKLETILRIVSNAGFKTYIKMAADNLDMPFYQKQTGTIYDVQLNIFCYR